MTADYPDLSTLGFGVYERRALDMRRPNEVFTNGD
jgi:hypothetical protein